MIACDLNRRIRNHRGELTTPQTLSTDLLLLRSSLTPYCDETKCREQSRASSFQNTWQFLEFLSVCLNPLNLKTNRSIFFK
jgi:hypothetical protein